MVYSKAALLLISLFSSYLCYISSFRAIILATSSLSRNNFHIKTFRTFLSSTVDDDTSSKINHSIDDKSTMSPLANINNGFLLLNSVAVLWGTQHVVIKSALDSYPSASVINFWRFLLSALLLLPALTKINVRVYLRRTTT
jgi:hypothetical protein